MESVDKSFEARVFATLDQQGAELRAVKLQGLGILLTVALVGCAVALLGKELTK